MIVEVDREDRGVFIHWRDGNVCHTQSLNWPEANKLQEDLRKACVEAGITVRG